MMVIMMVKIKIDIKMIVKDEDKYSLGGQGQDPKAGLVGPLTHPVQLKGNGHDKILARMTRHNIMMIFSYCSASPHSRSR